MAKKIDELERPKIPGYIDMSKVNSASAGVAAARDAVNNLNYDTFKQGSQYGNLKKSYEQQGQTAMKDTLGQVAARTGGMASSYATSAANQSYNNYMQMLEDAARSMFNDEYSKKMDAYNMAQQEYGNEWNRYQNAYSQAWDKYNAENNAYESDLKFNYQVGRDEKADSDAAKQDEIDMISSDAYYGRSVSWEQYLAAHPNTQLTQEQYESIVSAGEGRRTDENRTNVDNELVSILSDEDFNWDTDYDSIAGLIANSSYGMDYWKQYATDKQQGYAEGNKTDAQELVKDMWAAGLTPTDEQLVAAGYKTKGADGKYSWTDEGNAAMYSGTGLTDTELEQIFGAEGFDWDTYDFDKDGKVGKDDTNGEDMSGFFANSSFGEDYWRQFATDEQQGYADQDTKDTQTANTNEIEAMLKNGASLEEIEEKFGIKDGDGGKTWKDVTGMSKAEWQAKQTGYKHGSYKFQDTVAGRAEIVDKMLESGLSLNSTDASNFDYLFGDGAYETVVDGVEKFEHDLGMMLINWNDAQNDPDFFSEYIDNWEKEIMTAIPGISIDALDTIIETRVPDLINWLKNPEEAKQYIGKYYLDGRWITPAG